MLAKETAISNMTLIIPIKYKYYCIMSVQNRQKIRTLCCFPDLSAVFIFLYQVSNKFVSVALVKPFLLLFLNLRECGEHRLHTAVILDFSRNVVRGDLIDNR